MEIVKRISGVYDGHLIRGNEYGFIFKARVKVSDAGHEMDVVIWIADNPSGNIYPTLVICKSDFSYSNEATPCEKVLIQTIANEILNNRCNGVTMNSRKAFGL